MRLLDTSYGTVCPDCGHDTVFLRAHNKKIYCPNCDPKPRKIGTITLTGMNYNRTRREEMFAAITKDLTDHGFIDLKIRCSPKEYSAADIFHANVHQFIIQGRHTSPRVNTRLVELPGSERLYTYKYQDYEIVRYGDRISYGRPGFTNLTYNRKFNQIYYSIRMWMDDQNVQIADPSIYRTALNEYIVRQRTRRAQERTRQERLNTIQSQIRYLETYIATARSAITAYDEKYGEPVPNIGSITIRLPKLRVA